MSSNFPELGNFGPRARGAIDLRTLEAFRDVHTYSDKDQGVDSLHHTLGYLPYQAAPGNHKHYTNDYSRWFKYTELAPAPFLVDYGGEWGSGIYARYSLDRTHLEFTGMVKVTQTVAFGTAVMTLPAQFPKPKTNKMAAGGCTRATGGVEEYCRIDIRSNGILVVLPGQSDGIFNGGWFGFMGLVVIDCTVGN